MDDVEADVMDTELGLSVLRSLSNSEADAVQNRAQRAYQEGNLQFWKSRMSRFLGGDAGPPVSLGDDDMANNVRISSPENHYHLPPQVAEPNKSGVPNWVKGAALAGLGAIAGAGALYLLNRGKTDTTTPVTTPVVTDKPAGGEFSPGGVNIEVSDHQ